eukprot:9493092-Pyramimonas_sp.AAC.1
MQNGHDATVTVIRGIGIRGKSFWHNSSFQMVVFQWNASLGQNESLYGDYDEGTWRASLLQYRERVL